MGSLTEPHTLDVDEYFPSDRTIEGVLSKIPKKKRTRRKVMFPNKQITEEQEAKMSQHSAHYQ